MARKGDPIIYAITNTITGRCYIGSTCYKTDRWSKHRNDLRKGVHGNPHLQASWTKHGENSFTFEILEVVDCEKNRIAREQFWIDRTPVKFNIRKIAESNSGFKWTPEQRARAVGRTHSEEVKEKCRQIWLGKTLDEEHRAKIGDANRGRQHTAEARAKMSAASRHTCIMTPEQRARAANTRAKEYIVTSPVGEEFLIRNMRKFCRENGLQQALMGQVLRGRSSHHRGWKARHVEERVEAA